jgi:RNA polymerase sigma factor (sigma-70 family)
MINEETRIFGGEDLCFSTKKIGTDPQPVEFVSTTRQKWEMIKANALSNDTLFNARTGKEKPAKRRKKKSQSEIDREIVEAFYEKQTQDGFTAIWNRFHYGVQSYAFRFMNDWDKANDIAQDTFQKAWEKRNTYDPKKSVYSTWLYTICRNLALSQLQQQARDKIIDLDINDVFHTTVGSFQEKFASDDETYFVTDENGDISSNSYDGVTQKMYDASLGVMNEMDPLFVEIMDMRTAQDMTLKEISKKLGLSESRVKNVYYKNRDILRDKMLAEYGDLYDTYKEAKRDKSEKETMYA